MSPDDLDEALSRLDDLVQLRNLEPAKTLAAEILRVEPDNAGALVQLSYIARREGRFDEALTAAEGALASAPGFVWGHLCYGWALFGLERASEARAAAEAALAIDPEESEGWRLRGTVDLHARRLDGARQAAEAMLELDPTDTSGHDLMGDLLLEERDATGAREAYERVLALDPDDASARNGLAMVALLEDDPTAAVRHVRGAGRTDPEEYDEGLEIMAGFGPIGDILVLLVPGARVPGAWQRVRLPLAIGLVFTLLLAVGPVLGGAGVWWWIGAVSAVPLALLGPAIVLDARMPWTARARVGLGLLSVQGVLFAAPWPLADDWRAALCLGVMGLMPLLRSITSLESREVDVGAAAELEERPELAELLDRATAEASDGDLPSARELLARVRDGATPEGPLETLAKDLRELLQNPAVSLANPENAVEEAWRRAPAWAPRARAITFAAWSVALAVTAWLVATTLDPWTVLIPFGASLVVGTVAYVILGDG